MLPRSPKPSGGLLSKGIKAAVIFEVSLFIGTFIAWQQLRSSRGFISDRSVHIYWNSIIHLKNTPAQELTTELLILTSGNGRANCLNDHLFLMAILKSAFWLITCTGSAYALLAAICPNDSKLIKSLPEGQVHHNPKHNKEANFMQTLQRVAVEKKSMQEPEAKKTINTT